jgi:hypothetical protein
VYDGSRLYAELRSSTGVRQGCQHRRAVTVTHTGCFVVYLTPSSRVVYLTPSSAIFACIAASRARCHAAAPSAVVTLHGPHTAGILEHADRMLSATLQAGNAQVSSQGVAEVLEQAYRRGAALTSPSSGMLGRRQQRVTAEQQRQYDAAPNASVEMASIMHGDYRTARIGVRRTIDDPHGGAPHASRASLCVAA